MTVHELRRKFLDFFESRGHLRFPSGSLVPYDVTGRLDESLLFNGAGMVQFKPYFRGIAEPANKRLTNCQKCVRTGDIESVGDLTHLTFFEMLGNFSFGDYFKDEAIAYSWEFLTDSKWLALDPKRLAFTVFSEDDVAFAAWSKHLLAAGIEPETRIFRLGEGTNYWPASAFSNGPPGPCGPNTEMFYWTEKSDPPSGPYSREDYLRDEAEGKWLEIWNDVFIQYEWQGEHKNPERPAEGYRKLGMPPLPFQSVDTGMGLERTATVLGGYKSVYDTDVFQPVFQAIEGVAAGPRYGDVEETDRAMRIIADHSRTASFCIADGVLPGNSGRGYVLRRLIRRAVLKGRRVLAIEGPFLEAVFQGVFVSLGEHYSELAERRETILETLKSEEALFSRTLASGSEMLSSEISRIGRGATLDGELAFKLYDTYGFPLEVTQELCEEAGIAVDEAGYERALQEAQARSRGADGMQSVYGGVEITFEFISPDTGDRATPTEFVGYSDRQCDATIVGAIPELNERGEPTGYIALALDRTPFYAESGGQAADHGTIEGDGFTFEVSNVIKQDGVFVHDCQLAAPIDLGEGPTYAEAVMRRFFGQPVQATINLERRLAIQRNHTATHLLHAALRNVLGKHVTQAGSLVEANHLRFDFTHGKGLSAAEVAQVESEVNGRTLAGLPVTVHEGLPIAEAKAMGAMALFGEKYGDSVRMVEVEGYSRELCGGTHVRQTGEIGLFKILHESSAASGIRRIEAVSGEGAYRWTVEMQSLTAQASGLLKSSPKELVQGIERLLEQLREERKKREKLAAQGASGAGEETVEQIGAVEWVVRKLEDAEPKDAALIADRLADGQAKRVVFVATVGEGKVSFVCKAGPDAVKSGAHAGNVVKAAAQASGGGGGGRPDYATAGGRDVTKLDTAIAAARATLSA